MRFSQREWRANGNAYFAGLPFLSDCMTTTSHFNVIMAHRLIPPTRLDGRKRKDSVNLGPVGPLQAYN